MQITTAELAKLIDLSAVKAEDDDAYLKSLVKSAIKYQCFAVYPLAARVPMVRELLKGNDDILVGGAVGFPSGGETTKSKVFEAKELVSMGCEEIDMVINVSLLRSKRLNEVQQDISAVVEACGIIPVKVILECHYLTEEEIMHGCDQIIAAKAKWVKTGTGWAPTGATLKNIALLKKHVGDELGVKAAGGIRDLNSLLQMYKLGARRFGLGLKSSTSILEEAWAVKDGVLNFD